MVTSGPHQQTFPKQIKFNAKTCEEFFLELDKRRTELKDALKLHGAILIEKTPLANWSEFERAVKAFRQDPMQYLVGAKERKERSSIVYAPSSVPSYVPNRLHAEQGYLKDLPGTLAFFCEKPALFGGATTLGYSTKVYESIPASTRKNFEHNGVSFHRTLVKESKWLKRMRKYSKMAATAVSWEANFNTRDPNQVESICKNSGQKFRWTKTGDLSLSITIPAYRIHPTTGEKCWTNSAHLFQIHPRIYGRIMVAAAKLYFRLTGKEPSVATFGNGDKIPLSEIDRILDAMDQNTFRLKLKRGDFVLVDNYRVLHGRTRFFGPRKLHFAMYP